MLRTGDDCSEGTSFQESYFADGKRTSLTNFVSRTLERINFCARKNSIGQKFPQNWRELAVANSAEIRKLLREANVDVVINADQTFLKYYPEMDMVLAPTGAKRIGGKINVNEKAGITCMVSADYYSSRLMPPFLVFDGIKRVDAKNPQMTN